MADVLPSDELVDEASNFGSLKPGTRLGRYELLVPIARGGMARVWAARLHGQRGFQKLVAIKTILPHLAEEAEFERMFLDEARIASGVHHPNVCEIYELGEDQKTLYLAMEWVNGDSFARVLRASGKTEAIDPRVVARVVADACAGLHAAHELTDDDGRALGVVHRDLSPHNILLSADGVAKVADFGVAKALGQLHEETSAGQLKGKIAYMAPEQVTGSAIDRRSDVFSLGCVLYEATTGQRPFRGDGDHQVMHAVLKGEVVPPTSILRTYPIDLERIVMRALAAQPILRYPTAERMRFALEEFLANGQLVTQSNVAQVVRARIGEPIERRKERIKQASSTGDRVAEAAGSWNEVAGNHTPSHQAQQHRSGVKPSGRQPQAKPLFTTMQMDRPPGAVDPASLVPPPAGVPVPTPAMTPSLAAAYPGASYPGAAYPSHPGAQHPSYPNPSHHSYPGAAYPAHHSHPGVAHHSHPGVAHHSHPGVAHHSHPGVSHHSHPGVSYPPPPGGASAPPISMPPQTPQMLPMTPPPPPMAPVQALAQTALMPPGTSMPPAMTPFTVPPTSSLPPVSSLPPQHAPMFSQPPPLPPGEGSYVGMMPGAAPPNAQSSASAVPLPLDGSDPSLGNPGDGAPVSGQAGAGQYALAIVIGVLVAAVIGVGGFFVWRSRVHAPPEPSVAQTSASSSSVAAATATAPAAGAPTPISAEITFRVVPADATLTIDGADKPVEVRTVPRPPMGTTITIVAHAKGHEDTTVLVDFFTTSPLELTLKPTAEASAAAVAVPPAADPAAKPDSPAKPDPPVANTKPEPKKGDGAGSVPVPTAAPTATATAKKKKEPKPDGPGLPANPY